MTYPISLALIPIALAFGSKVALASLLLATAIAGVLAAEAVSRRFRLHRRATIALSCFFLFEPWVYNKVVAGHITQILSSYGLIIAFAEYSRPRPRFARLALALVVTSFQIQLFIIALVALLPRMRDRSVAWAVVASFVVFLPTILGLALDRAWLIDLPITVPWEDQQSVPLVAGFALGGYFLHYADPAFQGPAGWAILLIAVTAVVAPFVIRERFATWLATIAVVTLLFISGTSWWLAPLWRWAILNTNGIGVFREMYDLIGVVVAVYGICLGALLGRVPRLGIPAILVAAIVAAAWIVKPPAAYWQPAESLSAMPTVRGSSPITRFAIMPPFQPESFNGLGGGADPLYAGRAPDLFPVNALLPLFPENRALYRFWTRGDLADLQRLGVSFVQCRAGFADSPHSFFHDDVPGSGFDAHPCRGDRRMPVLGASPFAALESSYGLCSLCSNGGTGSVFVGDRFPDRFHALRHERSADAPEDGWIDARLAAAFDPELGQGLGGSFTSRPDVPLDLPSGPYALVNVRGILIDDRRNTIAVDTHGYRWVRLHAPAHHVSCRGSCLVVGVGDPGSVPLEGPTSTFESLNVRFKSSWLYGVTVPPGSSGIMRVLSSYDWGWVAFGTKNTSAFDHIRVDAVFNGWVIPYSGQARVIWLVHMPSLFQAAAEVIGGCLILIILGTEVRCVVCTERVAATMPKACL